MSKHSFFITALCILILSAAHPPALSDEINVPGDFPTIQDAINAAVDGDHIVVEPGTYVENINFMGKNIKVRSTLGPEFCTIDGGQSGSTVMFEHGETRDASLEGFTIANGSGTLWGAYKEVGGGICCRSASEPEIKHNIIVANTACVGGGIFASGSAGPVIFENLITYNEVKSVHQGTSPGGGGIYIRDFGVVRSNIITDNVSIDGSGGGIFCEGSATASVSGNIIARNYAGEGGGIACALYQGAFINNTIADNWANAGGGIDLFYGSQVEVKNCILYGNDAGYGSAIAVGNPWNPSHVSVSFCDVEGGLGSVYASANSTVTWGNENIDIDPCFVEPALGDYHLTSYSSCRNAGDQQAHVDITDFEGDPRCLDQLVDMGADEFFQHVYNRFAAHGSDGGFHVRETVSGGLFVDLKILGEAYTDGFLALGADYLDPPVITSYGRLFLGAPYLVEYLGYFPSNGVLVKGCRIPFTAPSGQEFPIQAFNGTHLSNGIVLRVE